MPAALAKTDPNIKVPAAVARHAAAAEAAFHAANGTAPAAEVVADPPATPQPEVVAPPAAPQAADPAAPKPPQDWEHAFKSMKGRHDSAQNSIREMSERITSLQNVIATMQVAPSAAAPAELRAASLLTPEEVGEYGVEFLDVVGKKALEQVSPEVAALKKELEGVKAQLGNTAKTTAANARNAMNTGLDQALPMWRQVNVAPEFHSWLALPDPFSGVIKLELLKAAYEQNDTPRVLAFFKGFLAHEAALDPAASAEPDPTVLDTGKIPLEAFAAPGRAKTAAAPGAPVEKPTFTSAQVSKFFAESAAGKYRGREAEKARIDAQIVEAGREGRIR